MLDKQLIYEISEKFKAGLYLEVIKLLDSVNLDPLDPENYEVCLIKAEVLIEFENISEAQKLLNELLSGNSFRSVQQRIQTLLGLIHVFIELGDYPNESKVLDELNSCFDKNPLSSLTLENQVKYHSIIGYYYQANNDYENAKNSLELALSLCQNLENKVLTGQVYRKLASYFLERRDFSAALINITQALKYFTLVNSNMYIILTNIDKGNIYNVKGDHNEFLESINLALSQSQKIEFTKGISLSLNQLGLYYMTRDPVKSFNYLKEESLLIDPMDLPSRMVNNFNLASVANYQNKKSLAISYAKEALSISLKYPGLQIKVAIYTLLGRLSNNNGVSDNYFVEALRLASMVPRAHNSVNLLFEISKKNSSLIKNATFLELYDNLRSFKPDSFEYNIYQLIEIKLLLATNRIISIAEAQKRLQLLINKTNLSKGLILSANYDLIKILLFEIQSTKNEEALIETTQLIEKLQNWASEVNSPGDLIKILMLNARVKFLQSFDVTSALEILRDGKNLAHSLQLVSFEELINEEENFYLQEIDNSKKIIDLHKSLIKGVNHLDIEKYVEDARRLIEN